MATYCPDPSLLPPNSSLSPWCPLTRLLHVSPLTYSQDPSRLCTFPCAPWGPIAYSPPSPSWHSGCLPGPFIYRKPGLTTHPSPSGTCRGSSTHLLLVPTSHVLPTCTLFLLVSYLQTPADACLSPPIPTFSFWSSPRMRSAPPPLCRHRTARTVWHLLGTGRCSNPWASLNPLNPHTNPITEVPLLSPSCGGGNGGPEGYV